jgi:hypothetical protein
MNLPFPLEVLLVVNASSSLKSTACKIIQSEEANTAYRRYLGAREAKNEWLVFLDEDCEILDQSFFTAIETQTFDIQAGFYLNAPGAGYWAKAFNSICNLWVIQNQSFLGGLFCVHRSKFPLHLNYLETPIWGADEAILCNYFRSAGLSIHPNPNLFVRHHANESCFRFFRRAFQHGRYKSLYQNDLPPRPEGLFALDALFSPYFSRRYIPAYLIHKIALICGSISRLQNKS